MYLVSAKVGPFRSISDSQDVNIDEKITVLVGMNEAGKTVFLKALEKATDVLESAKFDPVEDYPRKNLSQYLREHATAPKKVVVLTFRLTEIEVNLINEELMTDLKSGYSFEAVYDYANKKSGMLSVDEQPVVNNVIDKSELSQGVIAKVKGSSNLRELVKKLEELDLNEKDGDFLIKIKKRVDATKYDATVLNEVWSWVSKRMPKFLYFGEYELMPSKMNLIDLSTRISSKNNLKPEHLAVQALLRMADVSIAEITQPDGYETLKAKIEGVSISLTDQIKEFWKQNEDLEVEVDIKTDPKDEAPFNNGANLYLRIKNRKHRVGTPFGQRSRGFIWFFSFLVWFDSVQDQIDSDEDIILLLDEPGLSLHALAQEDLLNYIDSLAEKHQVIYSTHSPFMIHSDRLNQVRIVEDKPIVGSVISDNISASDSKTIFPLQAALGYTIAQNLFISDKNLLVEGPSDLIYLKSVASILESLGRTFLNDNVTIVPSGGLDKVATFVSLLGANGLKIVIFHDDSGSPEQKIVDLVKQKIITQKQVLTASQFRFTTGDNLIASDTEDLFSPDLYIDYFCKAFSKELKGKVIAVKDLPPGDRIINRIERYLKEKSIQLRPSGGFNHYTVASYFASHPPQALDENTLKSFEALFLAVNKFFK